MMKGIELVKDHTGELKEIRLAVSEQPDLAADIYRLISIHTRNEHHRATNAGPSSMNLKDFRKLVQEAKQSGELSETAFFQSNPEWQQKQKQSSSQS